MSACITNSSDQAKTRVEDKRFVKTKGIQPILYDTIRSYIRKNDLRLNGDPLFYYTIYSVTCDSGCLITLWRSSLFPDYIENNFSNKNFYLYKINNRKVILVSNNSLDNYLFDKSNIRQKKANALSKKKLLKYFYDGKMNMVSYLIQPKGSGISMKPSTNIPSFFKQNSVE